MTYEWVKYLSDEKLCLTWEEEVLGRYWEELSDLGKAVVDEMRRRDGEYKLN